MKSMAKKYSLKERYIINTIIISLTIIISSVANHFIGTKPNVTTFNEIVILVPFGLLMIVVVSFIQSTYKKISLVIDLIIGLLPVEIVNAISVFKNKAFIYFVMIGVEFVGITLICVAMNINEVKTLNDKIVIKFFMKVIRYFVILLCLTSLSTTVAFDIGTSGFTDNEHISYKYLDNDNIVLNSKIKSTNKAKTKDNSYSKYYLKELLPLVDGTWDKQSNQSKLDIYQILANIEASYNGFSKGVDVVFYEAKEDESEFVTLGRYSKVTNKVYLNLGQISKLNVEDSLIVLFHELYHCYQQEQIDMYNLIPETYKSLDVLTTIANWAEESEIYINSDDGDFDEYSSQKLEKSARQYGYYTALEYLNIIEEHYKEIDVK